MASSVAASPANPARAGVGSVSWNYSANPALGTLRAGQDDLFDIVLHDHSGATVTHTVDVLLLA
jgi:hypothetical protein